MNVSRARKRGHKNSRKGAEKLIMTIESQTVKNLTLSMRLQKTLKMTNKAILKIDQMNVTKVLTSDYNRLDTWYRRKNKAISKPICFEK